MADNTNEPRGARPCGRVTAIHPYYGATAARILPGDFVTLRADGVAIVATAGVTQLLGVAASYKSSTYTTVLVYDDPDQQFLIQDDGGGTTSLSSAKFGLNGDIVATASNGTTLKSRHTFDRNPIATTAANLRILGLSANQATGKYQEVRVVINEHGWAKKLTGVV